ncbi:hypothetical protein [Cyclobacterium amurskyense]|uniref:Fumarate hydratase n=1 Tax=Cyclobacterium amurskyense TaxID=320787 RepID=A0A0H4P7G8_9BACT|nr:hypothetical protein [Cyclobacterium amurskyense]AKP50396.1 Fumarate hydratase [Cyclobacterium amurskyense]|tara:strand:+ start:16099 stop:16581 length:483 start_codon:yes stop_codon:yes gene_type:complete
MVRLVPNYSETFVTTLGSKEVMDRVELITKSINYLDETNYLPKSKTVFFNGNIEENSFRISKIIDRADSFLPLIKGEIAPLSKGCLVSLNYSFFPGASFFLGFWAVISFGLTVLFLAVVQDWKLALLCFLVGLGNYGFACSYFKRKVRESQVLFHELMKL